MYHANHTKICRTTVMYLPILFKLIFEIVIKYTATKKSV